MTLYINFGKKKDIPMDNPDKKDGSIELIDYIRLDLNVDKSSEEWITCPEYPQGIPEWLGDKKNVMKLRHQTVYHEFKNSILTHVERMDCCASEDFIPRPVPRHEAIWCLKNDAHFGPLPKPPMPDWISSKGLKRLCLDVPGFGRPEGLTDQEYVLDYIGLIKPKARVDKLTDVDRAFLSYGNFKRYYPNGTGNVRPEYRSYKVADYERDEEETAAFVKAEEAREAAKPKGPVKELLFGVIDFEGLADSDSDTNSTLDPESSSESDSDADADPDSHAE